MFMGEQAESLQPTEQERIDAGLKKLYADCGKLLSNYGEKTTLSLLDKIFNNIANSFAPHPTKAETDPTILERKIFRNGKWEKVRIVDVDSKTKGDHQIKVIIGDVHKPEEFLVMEGQRSWIHIKPPPQDLNGIGTSPPSTRPVNAADLQKYQEAVNTITTLIQR